MNGDPNDDGFPVIRAKMKFYAEQKDKKKKKRKRIDVNKSYYEKTGRRGLTS